MNKRLFFKLSIDFMMFTIFLWLMLSSITTHYIHELLGVIFVVLLIIHTVFNVRWYKYILHGKYNLIRLLHTLVNLSLAGLIFINIVTALGISLWLFVFLPIDWGMTGRDLHILSAYWGLVLLSIHIGFHWDMLMKISKNVLHLSHQNKFRTRILQLVTAIIAIYGLYASFKLEIGARLIAYYSFFFLDPNQPILIGFIDYLAFCGFCISITHYGLKLLHYRKKTRLLSKQAG